MSNIISKLNSLVIDSDNLLSQEYITLEEITGYKRKCATVYVSLINKNINNTITELAERGLKYEVKKIKNPFYRWLYYQLTTARDNITYNAPFLKKHSDSDYNKKYIFWTKQKMMGIIHNLER